MNISQNQIIVAAIVVVVVLLFFGKTIKNSICSKKEGMSFATAFPQLSSCLRERGVGFVIPIANKTKMFPTMDLCKGSTNKNCRKNIHSCLSAPRSDNIPQPE